jgi:glycosyltransferase involved in cell wall biosynthesis
LHYALEAWLKSPAHRDGSFLIAGDFVPDYRRKLEPLLAHPSIKPLGHRTDVPELMRTSDILVLPTIEEGSPLVCAEAVGSGCVPLVSEVCSGTCRHMENALVHRVGDVETLARHLTTLHDDRALLGRLRAATQAMKHEITWSAAGTRLLDVYRDLLAQRSRQRIAGLN